MSIANSGAAQQTTSKGLNIAVWVVQALLVVGFGMAGAMKTLTPIAELGEKMAWVNAMSPAMVRFIGVSEFLGAVGLLLPSVLRIMPKLTVAAAGGLVLVMLLAAGFHVTRGELGAVPANVIMGAMAAFVGWGRMGKVAITAR